MRGKKPFETETALRIYNDYPNEIGNEQIKELFDVKGANSVSRIKREVRKMMTETEPQIKVWNKNNIDTETTFRYAGIDIDMLEKRYKKSKQLGLKKEPAAEISKIKVIGGGK